MQRKVRNKKIEQFNLVLIQSTVCLNKRRFFHFFIFFEVGKRMVRTPSKLNLKLARGKKFPKKFSFQLSTYMIIEKK